MAANAKLLSQTAHPAPPGPGRGEARGHQRSRGAPSSGGQDRESKSREDTKKHTGCPRAGNLIRCSGAGFAEAGDPASPGAGSVWGERELPSPSGASRLDS